MRTRRYTAFLAGSDARRRRWACPRAAAAEPAGNASSFGNVSGSAVPVADELTALCEQIVDAGAAPRRRDRPGRGERLRGSRRQLDGEAQAVTMDLREDRMNFEVEADIVTGCTVG